MKSVLDGMGEASKKAVMAGVGAKRPLEAVQPLTLAKQPAEKNQSLKDGPKDVLQQRSRVPTDPKKQAPAKKRARRAMIDESESDEELELEDDWSDSDSSGFNENREI